MKNPLIFLFLMLGWIGCIPLIPNDPSCLTDQDCYPTELCFNAICTGRNTMDIFDDITPDASDLEVNDDEPQADEDGGDEEETIISNPLCDNCGPRQTCLEQECVCQHECDLAGETTCQEGVVGECLQDSDGCRFLTTYHCDLWGSCNVYQTGCDYLFETSLAEAGRPAVNSQSPLVFFKEAAYYISYLNEDLTSLTKELSIAKLDPQGAVLFKTPAVINWNLDSYSFSPYPEGYLAVWSYMENLRSYINYLVVNEVSQNLQTGTLFYVTNKTVEPRIVYHPGPAQGSDEGTEEGFAVVSLEQGLVGRLTYAYFSLDGHQIGTFKEIDTGASHPTISKFNSSLFLAWNKPNQNRIDFTRLNIIGEILQSKKTLLQRDQPIRSLQITAEGEVLGLIWEELNPMVLNEAVYDIYFSRFNLNGDILLAPIKINLQASDNTNPSLVFNGETYALAWQKRELACTDTGHYDIFFLEFDPDGVPLSPEERLTQDVVTAKDPVLLFTGDNYCLVRSEKATIYDPFRIVFMFSQSVQ